MGCNFCDDCSECTVGCDLDCDMWDSVEHDSPSYDYEDDYPDYEDDRPDYEDGCPNYDDERPERKNEIKTRTRKLHCATCGKKLRKSWRVCPECGTSIRRMHCIHCGKKVNAKWNYCPRCGQRIITATEEQVDGASVRSIPQPTSQWGYTVSQVGYRAQPHRSPTMSPELSSVYDVDIPF